MRHGLAFLRFVSVCVVTLFMTAANAGSVFAQSPSAASASREIDAFARAWAHISSYNATVTIFEKDAQSQNVAFDYTFSKPSNVTVYVTAGPNSGVTLDWTGGTTVVAHRGSGLSAMFKRTLSLHDPQVTTLRGASIDQLSFGAILAHVQQQPGSLSMAPGEMIGGAAVNAVTLIPSASAADAGLTREVLELSAATHLPVRLLGYVGSTLVRKIDLGNIKLRDAAS